MTKSRSNSTRLFYVLVHGGKMSVFDTYPTPPASFIKGLRNTLFATEMCVYNYVYHVIKMLIFNFPAAFPSPCLFVIPGRHVK